MLLEERERTSSAAGIGSAAEEMYSASSVWQASTAYAEAARKVADLEVQVRVLGNGSFVMNPPGADIWASTRDRR
jgi:hypothetical protein